MGAIEGLRNKSGEELAIEALPGKWRSFGNRCPPRKVLALEALPVEFLAIEALPTECNRGSRRSASSRQPSWTQNHRCKSNLILPPNLFLFSNFFTKFVFLIFF